MSEILINVGAFWGALLAMEGVAWVTHKYVMHGFLWCWHMSHHLPRQGTFEKNDLFALVFAMPSIVLIYIGTIGTNWSQLAFFWAGLGVASYGLIYFLFHDVLVHRRIHHQYVPRNKYLRRIVHAHRLHHVIITKEDGVSFGFLWASPPLKIREEMKVLAAKVAAQTEELPQQ